MLFKYKLHYRSELHLAVVCNHVIDVFNYYTSQLTSLKNLLQIERSRNSKHTSAWQNGRICLPHQKFPQTCRGMEITRGLLK